jgi:hypothetical protein
MKDVKVGDVLSRREGGKMIPFGRVKTIERNPGKPTYSVTLRRGGHASVLVRDDEDNWAQVQDAMIGSMIRLEHALRPFISKLPV